MIHISKYLDDCLVKYSNYKPSKKNKKSFIEGNEDNFKNFIQKILEFNDNYKKQKRNRRGDSRKKSNFTEDSEEEMSDEEDKRPKGRERSRTKSAASKKGAVQKGRINEYPTRGMVPVKGRTAADFGAGLEGLTNKHNLSRTSKTECLNKLMDKNIIKSRRVMTRLSENRKETDESAHNIAQYMDNAHIYGDDTNGLLVDDPQFRPNQPESEFIIPSDEFEDDVMDNNGRESTGRKNLTIAIPKATHNYKFIKDSMFPDSKGKGLEDNRFLKTPMSNFGIDDRIIRDHSTLTTPMFNKRGGMFLGTGAFSPSGGISLGRTDMGALLNVSKIDPSKIEMTNKHMEKALDELKNNIKEKSHIIGEPKHETNGDASLAKRSQPSEGIYHSVYRKLKIEEPKDDFRPPLISPMNHGPVPLREEVQTPKPQLNIRLIDSTYEYQSKVDSMWDGPQTSNNKESLPKETHHSDDENYKEFDMPE